MKCFRVVSSVAAGVLIAGCGGDTNPGQPPQAPIPPVQNPRNISAVADRPCDLLSPQQAATFGLDLPPRQLPGTSGHIDCEWRSSRADVWIYISTFIDTPILERVYAQRESLPYFKLTEINDYPAILSRTDAALPACDVDIKSAERQGVTVSYDSTALGDNPQQGCVIGRQVAQTVLGNIPSTG